jgi:hypothetical protein
MSEKRKRTDNMTTSERLKEDSEFLRSIANSMQARMDGEEGEKPEPEDVSRLRSIAKDIEEGATAAERDPELELEARAARLAVSWINTQMRTQFEPDEEIQLFLWLIYRALKSNGNKALIGQGLSGLGIGAMAAMFKGDLGKQPLDPEDK